MKYIMKKRQYGLLSEQEEEILVIPYDHFKDWSVLQTFLNRRKNPPYEISGDLDLQNAQIESLGSLESVSGNVNLSKSSIQSLGNLRSVSGSLDLRKTNIESLGNLTSVGDDLFLDETPITSLGNLKSVGGDLYLGGSSIESFGDLKSIGGNLYLYGTPFYNKPEKDIRSMVNVGGIISVKNFYEDIIDDVINYFEVVLSNDDFISSYFTYYDTLCETGFDEYLDGLAAETILIFGLNELGSKPDYNDNMDDDDLSNYIYEDFGIEKFKDILLERHGDQIWDYYYSICDDDN